MADTPYTKCPACGQAVDPSDPDAVYAVKQANRPGFGQSDDWIDDAKAFFHPTCSPERKGYERRQRPASASA